MTFYKILVQPAKSSKGSCKVCGQSIQQDNLRLQVVDDRKFNEYIRTHGGFSKFSSGQGMYRGGYIETQKGTISREKYFVHLDCYTPIHPHPFQVDKFKLQHFSERHKVAFNNWLIRKQPESMVIMKPIVSKKSNKKCQNQDGQQYDGRRKKISKARRK